MRGFPIVGILVATGVAGCASGPPAGGSGYRYSASGDYVGHLTVEGEQFDASLELETTPGGRLRGTFLVGTPFDIDGRVQGRLIDDLVRMTITYDAGSGNGCTGRVEGILDIGEGGEVIDGPVTITDCEDELPGKMSFRRQR